MLWEHEPLASVSTAFLSSPNLSQVFLQLSRNKENIFLFLLENTTCDKKQENNLFPFIINIIVNSLCMTHHYVNSSC